MAIQPVSIIICTRNRAALLSGMINQLYKQEYPHDAFEIIVIDHLSTDNTAQVAEKSAKEKDIALRYFFEKEPGVTSARNRGAHEARYPYLAYLDDDCTVEATWLTQLMAGFDLNKAVVAVGGQIVLKWEEQRPAWFGFELEPWLAGNARLGNELRLLDIVHEHIVEGNMALKKEAWLAAGGFLGMEQFGSLNMAAGEVIFLLYQLQHNGGKVAFAPLAVAYHHVVAPTRKRMIRRAYWQGVSDGILDFLLYRRSWLPRVGHIILDFLAMLVLMSFTCLFFIIASQSGGMFHLLRAVRRFGLILSEMQMVGDWNRVRAAKFAHWSIS